MNTSATRNTKRKILRRRPPPQQIEEEKKEIADGDEEQKKYSFSTSEFRRRVAHEAADLDKEGNNYFEQGDYDQAFLCYEKALKLKRVSLQADPSTQDCITETEAQKASILASVATSINNMTYLRQRAGQASADETMAAYLKSLQIKREILGPDHLSVGKTLNNIGSVFYLKREFLPALKAYENAHEIMAGSLGADHLDVGTVLSNIGDVFVAMGKRKKALHYYRLAVNIRWAQLDRTDPKVVRLMEQMAALETGKQPRRRDNDLSDSEGEEFAEEDRKRRTEFQQECQALQQELMDDIKFFDLVERNLAIEFVQERAKFMRHIRQSHEQMGDPVRLEDMFDRMDLLEDGIDDEQDDLVGYDRDLMDFELEDFDDYSVFSVASAPPTLISPEKEKDDRLRPSDLEIGSPDPNTIVISLEAVPTPNCDSAQTPTKDSTPSLETQATCPTTCTSASETSFYSPTIDATIPTPKRKSSFHSYSSDDRRMSSISPTPTSPSSWKQSRIIHSNILSPGGSSPGPHRRHSSYSGSDGTSLSDDFDLFMPMEDGSRLSSRKKFKSLTPEERNLALLSVQERLAALRLKRLQEEEEGEDDDKSTSPTVPESTPLSTLSS